MVRRLLINQIKKEMKMTVSTDYTTRRSRSTKMKFRYFSLNSQILLTSSLRKTNSRKLMSFFRKLKAS